MTMTKEEIVREYREAKYPEKQIRILADENACGVSNIREILKEAGCLLPRQKKASPESESGEGREPQSVAENKDEWPEEDPAGYSAALREMVHAYEALCAYSGYVGLTEDRK